MRNESENGPDRNSTLEGALLSTVTDRTNLAILHVAALGTIGGLERVLHDLAIGHRRRGHNVHVAALISGDADYGPVLDPLRAAGVPTHVLSIRPYTVLRERSFIRSICEKHKIRIVHTHGYRADIVDSGAARRMGLANVSTEHGMSKMGGRTRIYEWLQMRLFKKFDAVIAVSKPIATTLERSGVYSKRIHVIPNAWSGEVDFLDRNEARVLLRLESDKPVIGWVGRLIHAKGADVFLRALAQLRDLPLRAALIGDGPEQGALEQLREELGLTESVSFCGALPDARRYFRAFDVFALSSRTEGTPIVLFEAMAAAVPVVATAVGGVPDVVTPTESFLTPPDDARGLANALKKALQDSEDANRRASRARQRLQEEYAIDHWLDRYEVVYHTVLTTGTELRA